MQKLTHHKLYILLGKVAPYMHCIVKLVVIGNWPVPKRQSYVCIVDVEHILPRRKI